MKFLTTNRFFRIIKRLLLLLPLSFLAVTSLYVVFNPNAKDSYYGDTINDIDIHNVEYNKFQNDVIYTFNSQGYISSEIVGVNYGSSLNRLTFELVDIISNPGNIDLSDLTQISFSKMYYIDNDYFMYIFFDDVGNQILNSSSANVNVTFTFRYLSSTLLESVFTYGNFFTYDTYNQYSYLSNALEYGMYQFNNIGFGKLDLVSWFSGIFANNNTNVYIQFMNSYFNYVLMVECVAILPMFIHWIIHLFEDAIDYMKIGNKKRKDND